MVSCLPCLSRIMGEQKENHVSVCTELKDRLHTDPDFMAKIVTGDESWVYGYDPETKIQSSQWKTSNSPRPKNARQSKSNIKVMLIDFFDSEGIVRSEFIPRGCCNVCEKMYEERDQKNGPMPSFFIATTRRATRRF